MFLRGLFIPFSICWPLSQITVEITNISDEEQMAPKGKTEPSQSSSAACMSLYLRKARCWSLKVISNYVLFWGGWRIIWEILPSCLIQTTGNRFTSTSMNGRYNIECERKNNTYRNFTHITLIFNNLLHFLYFQALFTFPQSRCYKKRRYRE